MQADFRELWMVMSKYHLITYKISHYRQEVFQIETNEGLKALKICSNGEEKNLFIYGIMNHLWKKGFRKISPPILSSNGHPYVLLKDKIYLLNDWIHGRQCNFDSYDDLKAAASTLAEFHKYSCGLKINSETKARIMTHRWITTLTDRGNDLKAFVNLATKTPSLLGAKYLEHYKDVVARAEKAREMLITSEYPKIASEAIEKGFFVHRDVAGRNFIMHKRDAWLIDFDYARFDVRVVDIVRILERGLRNHQWNVAMGRGIIEAYNLINPIGREEYPIILAFLTWPQKTWRFFDRYFSGKKNWQEEILVRKFNNIMRKNKYQNKFLNWFEKEYCR